MAFVDADDSIDKDYYQSMITLMNDAAVDMVVSNWYTIDESGEKTNVDICFDGIHDARAVMDTVLFDDTLAGGGYPWNRVVNYQRIKNRAGGHILFPKGIHAYEDKCWVLNVMQYCDKILFTPNGGYHYFIRSGSLSQSFSAEKMQQVISSWYYCIEIFKASGLYSDMLEQKMYGRIVSAICWLQKKDKDLAIKEWDRCKLHFCKTKKSIKVRIRTLLLNILLK